MRRHTHGGHFPERIEQLLRRLDRLCGTRPPRAVKVSAGYNFEKLNAKCKRPAAKHGHSATISTEILDLLDVDIKLRRPGLIPPPFRL
jgi:hypothetical protein